MKKIPLHWQIIIGLLLGVLYALVSAQLGWSAFTMNWIEPFGRIFLNLLKLIAVPLVLFSIIVGVSSLRDAARLGRLAGKTFGLYILTTVSAITIGLLLANIFNPGGYASEDLRLRNRIRYELWAEKTGTEIKDHLNYLKDERYAEVVAQTREAISAEPVDSTTKKKIEQAQKNQKKNPLEYFVDIVPSNIFFSLNDNTLMLQVIFFAIFFGIALVLLPAEKSKSAIEIFDSLLHVFLKMVDVIMRGAPFFVFALLAGKIAEMAGDNLGNVVQIFKGLSIYSLLVVAGLALVLFVIYPALVIIFSKKKIGYRQFFRGMGPAQLLAFSTSSSAATLPVTMECVNENLGVSEEISSFVLPIGATVNMDGTSLYQAVAVVFLAQFHLVELDLAQQIVVVLTAVLASIGAAAVPGAGLVMMVMILGSVGLDPAWIAIILPIDRILDMCRTVVNVTGDATVSVAIAASEGELKKVNSN